MLLGRRCGGAVACNGSATRWWASGVDVRHIPTRADGAADPTVTGRFMDNNGAPYDRVGSKHGQINDNHASTPDSRADERAEFVRQIPDVRAESCG